MKDKFELFKDFKVKYKFRSYEDGGQKTPAHQGIRSDFWYQHVDNIEDEIFMIWPIFEDESGNLIESGIVNNEGIARMKIVNQEMIEYHKTRIKIGVKGYFMEGLRKVADCEIIELGEKLI